jgi:predicted choloylglycine hydrolase
MGSPGPLKKLRAIQPIGSVPGVTRLHDIEVIVFLRMKSIREDQPGSKWQQLFDQFWPSYRKWFLSEGLVARPGYVSSRNQLRLHMPELMPIYRALCALSGGGDLEARFLSMYGPPPYLAGCSQAVWQRGDSFLIRNYDYDPRLFEGVLLYTSWNRPVIAVSDCLWGVLDGMNDAGLVVSLAFGGRNLVGEGFGVPLVLRYILETCDTASEAAAVLQRIPVHMTYSVTVLDRAGASQTAFLAPDRPAAFSDAPAITNHQQQIEWADYARTTASQERLELLESRLSDARETPDQFGARFLHPPLYNTSFEKGFGTLYTSLYRPYARAVELRWPNEQLHQSFSNFSEATTPVNLKRSRASFRKNTIS